VTAGPPLVPGGARAGSPDGAGPDPASLFPGGTAVTHLTVYDWSGPDGVVGGSAHVHLACTEGYVVLRGRGRLQTLSRDGFGEIPLTPMTVAWFSPGVIHRLVNDGDLQILVVMQNAGLPEAGDSVLTFPSDHLASPDAYQAVASLPGAATAHANAAQRRKDLAIEGFLRLREQVAENGPKALDEFYAAAAKLVRDAVPGWRARWEAGPLAAAVVTGEQLDLLSQGRTDYLHQGRLTLLPPRADLSYGMCGRLAAYPPRATSRRP
jgi:mannose-6-phosphate isomerase-like protein (cupin superfamily)